MIEPLAELLILLLFLLGPALVGYFLGHIYPVEILRGLCGTAAPPPPPPGEDLRQAVRLALRAPPSASDVDLVSALFELRREAEGIRPCLKAICGLLSDVVDSVTDPDGKRALQLVEKQLRVLARCPGASL